METVNLKMGVYKDGAWLLDYDGNYVWNATVDKSYNFGVAGSIPVIGDWNGNGKAKIGIFKSGVWYLDMNGNGVGDGPEMDRLVTAFGQPGWTPMVGKWG